MGGYSKTRVLANCTDPVDLSIQELLLSLFVTSL